MPKLKNAKCDICEAEANVEVEKSQNLMLMEAIHKAYLKGQKSRDVLWQAQVNIPTLKGEALQQMFKS